MENLKPKLYIIGAIALVAIFIGAVYLFFKADKSPESESEYPESVQNAINNPVDRNGDWSTLIDNENYQISYSTSSQGDSFFITVNSEPVVGISQNAETALLQKLGVEKEYLCTLPVVINVPYMVNAKLSEYNFGLSFCPDRIHVSDVSQSEPINSSSTNNSNNGIEIR